ncbi:GntR family transcriptional regulator [Streptomyces fulvoviolaceus]|uniref:GntR family transcriptional regulator n=1 Tax=Streptomyces fulvoviolaceus TaxID=285535 RepID=UPI00069392D8|nr:winged helix-turn-helix domain-containing protein [Streptomyces fulvoviolaceus]MCT9081136.1 winged helix-turn-helix domain-containing protein [Streptomyces fulvoviolaceus]
MSDRSEAPDFNPQGSQLIYVAVASHIEARIRAGELQPGARLPAERDLAQEYGVAYLTVRRAAQVLCGRGLIETVHGRGTFVADPLPEAAADAPGPGNGPVD